MTRPYVEAEVLREVCVPVATVVAARPDMEADVCFVGSQLVGERLGARTEVVVVTDVDPDRCVVRGVVTGGAEQVVAREVSAVVERAEELGRVAEEDRGRVSSHRAEAFRRQSPEVEGAEAALEIPPIATRLLSAWLRASAAGIASRRTYLPHGCPSRSCQKPTSPSGRRTTGARFPSARSADTKGVSMSLGEAP